MKILFQYKDIEISTDDTLLVIRNSNICRKLDLSAGAPKTVSLTDATGKVKAYGYKIRPSGSLGGIKYYRVDNLNLSPDYGMKAVKKK